MKRRVFNILAGEIIGKTIFVVSSCDHALAGKTFTIVKETKNTLITSEGKVIPKRNVIIELEGIRIYGKILIGRPEERPKLIWRRLHGKRL